MSENITLFRRQAPSGSGRWRFLLQLLVLLGLPLLSRAQTLTQADFTGVVVPQYMGSGTATRLPVLYRATVSNLTPSTLYRYYTQAATNSTAGGGTVDIGGTNTGAGNPLLINNTTGTYTYYTGSVNLATAGSYETFTTDASGAYTGWFGFLNTGNARFTGGNIVFPTITIGKDATPATIEKKLALNQGITVLAFATTAGASNGTFIKGASFATPSNLVAIYDNTAATGRPLAVTVVEPTSATLAAVITGYSTTSGSWNTIIPNTNANGVQRVEERSVLTGGVVNCNTDPDGTWPSGAITVNPTGGTTAVQLTSTDAPLNAGCGAVGTPTITISTNGPLAFTTTTGTNSAVQTYTVAGTNLTANITVTAPAGYQISADGVAYSSALTLTQTGGSVASKTISVQLLGTTNGTFSGNITNVSGTASQSVAVTGTVGTAAPAAPTITGFTPASGPVGTVITLTGTDFTGATAVAINGTRALTFTVTSNTTLTVPVPAGATSGAIAVTTPAGTGSSATNFIVTTPPTIASFTPTSGPVGTVVTITGTNFTGATAVSFNGTVTTTFNIVSATSITVAVPPGATTGTIAITTPDGTATSTTSFTVSVAAPVITALAPAIRVAGSAGFTLTVAGTGFVTGATVTLNGTALTTTFVSATSLTAAVPTTALATAGTYAVTVTNPSGPASAAATFTVSAATAGLFEDFEQGTKTGYASATVALQSGDWTLADALLGVSTSDKFNGTRGTRIRGGGTVTMNFDKPNGAGVITLNAALYGADTNVSLKLEISTDGGTTYADITGTAPTLTATLAPYTFTANRAGSIRIRVSSTNTAAATNPRFNLDDISITDYTAPATPVLTVTPATLTAFSTTTGTASAAQTFTTSGTNLTADLTVTAPAGYEVSLSATTGFASTVTVAQTSGTVTNATIYVRLTGAASGSFAGNVTVGSTGATAQNVAVTGTVTAPVPAAPTIASFTPTSGPVGTVVTITGTNFTGTTAVSFNGTVTTTFNIVSATSITVAVPSGATTGTIAVTTPGGTATSATSFTVVAPNPTPVITSLSPASVAEGSGPFTIIVTGTGFLPTSTVTFIGVSLPVVYLSATRLSLSLPAGATVGTYPIIVTNPTPGGGASAPFIFTVTPRATITSLSPNTAVAGSAAFTLTVTGTNFVSGSVVNFNGAALATTFVSATQLTAAVPASALVTAGSYNVTIVSPASSTSAAATFTVTIGTATRNGQDLAGFALYPNPTVGEVTVELPKGWNGLNQLVRLTDLAGRTVLQTRLGADGKLDLRTLAAGTYLVTIGEGQQRLTRRVLKN